MRRRIVCLALTASSCSLVAPLSRPPLDCWSAYCPDLAELQHALNIAATTLPGFDATAQLSVEWNGHGQALRRYPLPDGRFKKTVGETPSGSFTRVSSFSGLAHELIHVQAWRDGRLGNPDHLDWPQNTEEALKEAFTTEGLTP